jgi:membrane protein implicated in regulation of membrane protease activity
MSILTNLTPGEWALWVGAAALWVGAVAAAAVAALCCYAFLKERP